MAERSSPSGMMQGRNRGGGSRQGQFPVDDLTYDLIAIIHNKSKGLEAYDKYIEDANRDEEVSELLQELRNRDEEDVRDLKHHLARLLEEEEHGGGRRAA